MRPKKCPLEGPVGRDDRPERAGRQLLGLELLSRAPADPPHDRIERYEGSVGFGLNLHLPLSPVRPLQGVAVTGGEYRVAVHYDLAIFFLDRKKLVSRAFRQRFRRLVVAAGVLRLGRQRNGRNDGHARLDAGLPERGKQPDLVDGFDADAVGDIPQKTLGGLDQALAPETVAWARSGEVLSVSSRSTYSRRMCMKSCALVTTPKA